MTVTHDTFTIERSYPSAPSRVFAAFATAEVKRRWFIHGDGVEPRELTIDFRVGGIEQSRFQFNGSAVVPPAVIRNDTYYVDIVTDRRIVFAYSMTMGDRRISASLVTVELEAAGSGTRLTFTEQAAFFEGADGADVRKAGWTTLLGRLDLELMR
jgi:uncharacterized protein YndB with AHSA1/START domain